MTSKVLEMSKGQIQPRTAYAISALIGAVIWIAVTLASGRREAWDSGLYWTMGYPAGIAAAAVLGWMAPARAWRWGVTLMLAQAVALAAMANSWGLLPLGLILFGILSLPVAGAAVAVAAGRQS
jgi:hypothetical protein